MRHQSCLIWLCAIAGLSCCRGQLLWLDSDNAVSAVLEPAPFAFLMLLPPNRAGCGSCAGLTALFQMAGKNFPFITAVDCGLESVQDGEILSKMCDDVLDEPHFRKWNGAQARDKTTPFVGMKTSDGLVRWISEGFRQMQAAARAGHGPPIHLLMPFVQQSEAMKKALEHAASAGGSGGKASGELTFLSDQLPAWFRCKEYSFTGDGDKTLGELLLTEFLPAFGVQHKFAGKQWRMAWELQQASSKEVSFTWWESPSGPETKNLKKPAQPHRKQVTLRRAPGRDGRVGRECMAPLPGEEEEEEGKAEKAGGEKRVVMRTAQPGAAYDWMRFRFFEFADHMAGAIAQREAELPAGAAQGVFVDPMCGLGWELLLLKAKFGGRLTTVCSDVHAGSVALARADFEENGLDADGRALFLVGDMFEPLRKLVTEAEAKATQSDADGSDANAERPEDAKEDVKSAAHPEAGPSHPEAGPSHPEAGPSHPEAGPSHPQAGPSPPRPRYVYALPPQEPPPAQVPTGINSAFFFTPDGDPLHFHKRIANELPSLLAEGAIVWLSVEFDKNDGVHEEFAARVEKVFADAGWPAMEHIIDNGTPEVPYFNPSGLVQFDWGVGGVGRFQKKQRKKERTKKRAKRNEL